MSIPFVKQNGAILNEEMLLKKLKVQFEVIMNGEYLLIIDKPRKSRTINQNNLLWLWLTCVSSETGQDKNDLYDYYRDKFLSRTVFVNGNETRVSSGTSTLNTVQMKQFLDMIQEDVSVELGIKLPNPEDLYWDEFQRHYSRMAMY